MDTPSSCPRGYILQSQVVHARLLPATSAHAFTYPTLFLLLSLNALENHSLDLGRGWIFGYGGRWARLVGLRADPYLTPNGGSIRQRLEKALQVRGFAESKLEDAWMMTMPSLLGFEGINPLSVYFCYRLGGKLFLVVLEVHNTFGESHLYFLEIGKNEDEAQPKGFDHQWTFPRAFHVSPFNDRRGFYRVSIKKPTHAPGGFDSPPPQPTVRIHMYTQTDDPIPAPGMLKLTALLRPTSVTPLTSRSLLSVLSRFPFDLFLSFARILYHAWILHYLKHLDVFVRPEPIPVSWSPDYFGPLPPVAGGVRWIAAGPFERYSMRQVQAFLRRRVNETGIPVTLLPGDPSAPPCTISPSVSTRKGDATMLTISYLSPRAFTLLLIAPSAHHALLLGAAERVFTVSSAPLFHLMFAAPPVPPNTPLSCRQRLRRRAAEDALPLAVPARHALDSNALVASCVSVTVVCVLLLLDRLEEWVFRAVRARPVPGTEPWGQWKRAALAHSGVDVEVPKDPTGSFRREERDGFQA
ncbi:hypothetical protein GGX14DRAFT_663383, partial [Mycena pura]